MKLQMTSDTYGSYAYIAINRESARAVKVFKRTHGIDHTQLVFHAEADAYRIASSDPQLSELTPVFFGLCHVESLASVDGRDLTSEIFNQLAYEIQYVAGDFVKQNLVPREELKRIKALFGSRGINYLADASYCLNAQNNVACVIDFATHEFELTHDERGL